MVLKIEPLDSRKHLRSDFCCGKDSLDNYIRLPSITGSQEESCHDICFSR